MSTLSDTLKANAGIPPRNLVEPIDCTPPSQRHDNLSEPGANAFDAAAFEFHLDTGLDIDAAFEELMTTRSELCDYADLAEFAQQEWADAKVEVLTGGYIDGKNAETREAQLADRLTDYTARLRTAQKNERAARLRFEIAQDRLSRIRLIASLINS